MLTLYLKYLRILSGSHHIRTPPAQLECSEHWLGAGGKGVPIPACASLQESAATKVMRYPTNSGHLLHILVWSLYWFMTKLQKPEVSFCPSSLYYD